MMRAVVTFTALSLLVASCSCDGDSSADPRDADASDQDAGVVQQLAVQSVDVGHAAVAGLKLTDDETTVVVCTSDHSIGFVDAASLEVSKVVDVPELGEVAGAQFWVCRLSIIGDHAYAYFTSDVTDGPTVIVKISVATRTVVDVWPIPEQFRGSTMETKLISFAGLQPTSDPNTGVLAHRGSFRTRFDGITAVYVDLETGVVSSDGFVEVDGVYKLDVYSAIGPDRIFGTAFRESPLKSFSFVASLTERRIVWTDEDERVPIVPRIDAMAVDEAGDRMLLTSRPSTGWQIRRTDDGSIVRSGEYAFPGLGNFMTWLPNGRLLHLTSGSVDSWVSIMDEQTLAPLAAVNLPRDTFIRDFALSSDRTRVFVAASGYVSLVTLPEN